MQAGETTYNFNHLVSEAIAGILYKPVEEIIQCYVALGQSIELAEDAPQCFNFVLRYYP